MNSIVDEFTQSKITLFYDTKDAVTLLVESSSPVEAGKLSRLIRNRLMSDFATMTPSLATLHVDRQNSDADSVLSKLDASLRRNIEENSSRVEVQVYRR